MKRTISSVVPGSSRSGVKRARTVKARKPNKGDTLGRLTGKIAPSKTTLSLAPGPFTGKKYMTFIYENELTQLTTAAAFTHAQVMSNSLYDFDKNGVFGNKQPLYFDTMVTAAGPYRQYKVISWKTTYTVYNASVAILLLLLLFLHMGIVAILTAQLKSITGRALRDSILPRPKEDKTSELYPLQDMSMTCTLQSQEIMGWLELVQPTQEFPFMEESA